MTYETPASGEWVQPVRRGYKLACCDCDLVHKMDFRVVKGRAQFRVFRDNRATAAIRRADRLRVEIPAPLPNGNVTVRKGLL